MEAPYNLLHGNTLSSEDSIVLQLKNDVRLRLLTRCSTKMIYRYLLIKKKKKMIYRYPHLVEVWILQQVLSGY